MHHLTDPQNCEYLIDAWRHHVEQRIEQFAIVREIEVKTAIRFVRESIFHSATHLSSPLPILVDSVDLNCAKPWILEDWREFLSDIRSKYIIERRRRVRRANVDDDFAIRSCTYSECRRDCRLPYPSLS